MGRTIIKTPHPLRPYLEWSSIVDAPVTYGMNRETLRRYVKEENGNEGLRTFNERLDRADRKGTSSFMEKNVKETISCNRAGKGETRLTMDQIVDFYCERMGNGDMPEGKKLT